MKHLILFTIILSTAAFAAEPAKVLKLDKKTAIEKYSQGKITIGGQLIRTDIIILADGTIKHPWATKKRHLLTEKDIEDLLNEKIDVLIIGTGIHGHMKISSGLKKLFKNKKYEVMQLKTKKAIKKLQALRKKGKKTAACLHIGC